MKFSGDECPFGMKLGLQIHISVEWLDGSRGSFQIHREELPITSMEGIQEEISICKQPHGYNFRLA